MLDTNAFDALVADESNRVGIVGLTRSGTVSLFTTYVQERELLVLASVDPHKYWRTASIPRSALASSVFVLDHTPLGSGRLGAGTAYEAVWLGPKHVDDAVIADTAKAEDLPVVTNDRRLRRRAEELGLDVWSSAELITWMRTGCRKSQPC
ncbi:MAG: PIN domain-containing protein [Actinomycetota bacterium]|nr:PIN domain-containing protein [Actinomycetota bacterium]